MPSMIIATIIDIASIHATQMKTASECTLFVFTLNANLDLLAHWQGEKLLSLI